MILCENVTMFTHDVVSMGHPAVGRYLAASGTGQQRAGSRRKSSALGGFEDTWVFHHRATPGPRHKFGQFSACSLDPGGRK